MPAQNLWGNARQTQAGWDWAIAHASSGNEQTTPDAPLPTHSESRQGTLTNLPLLRLIGQIGASFLIAEGPDGLYLIDQHAAHERVLFEKLMAQHDQKNISSQSLLTPVVVTLTPAQTSLINNQLPILQHFGFQVVKVQPLHLREFA